MTRQGRNSSPGEGEVYKLRVVLRDVSPLIWRHLMVPSGTTLAKLHVILQVAFGWTGCHLYSFRIYHQEYGPVHGDAHRPRLGDFRFHCREKFRYIYDFGDWWEADVRLLDVERAGSRKTYPTCVGGNGAGPPEDCGGADSYVQMLDHCRRPSLDVLEVFDALEDLLEADADQPIREALASLELQDTICGLDRLKALQPSRFSRRELNAALWELEKRPR